MGLQNFVSYVGPKISAWWLNEVDRLRFTVFASATTKAEARTALTTDLPLEIGNGGTGVRTLTDLQDAIRVGLYPQSVLEVNGGVTPLDLTYPWGHVKRYGAVMDGATDDSTAIQAALSLAHPVTFDPGTYYFATPLTWNVQRGIIHANGAKLITDLDIDGLILGVNGGGNSLASVKIFGDLTIENTSGGSTKTGLMLRQVREADLHVSVSKFYKGVELQATAGGTQFNNIYPNAMMNNYYGVYFNPSGTGWCNENNFWAGRFGAVSGTTGWHIYLPNTGSTYGRPNNNKFFGPSLEVPGGAIMSGVYFDNGISNSLVLPRFESLGTITDIPFRIGQDAITARVLFPYLTWVGTEGATDLFDDQGAESIIFAQDKLRVYQRSGGTATEVLELSRDRGNSAGKPVALFRDLYQDSQTGMGLKVDVRRRLVAGDYYFKGATPGSIVVGADTRRYECILAHTATADDEPGVGVNWATYWVRLGGLVATSTTWLVGNAYEGPVDRYRVDADGQVLLQKVRQGFGAPGTSANYIGECYIDKTNNKIYFATTTGTGGADWVAVN